MTDLISREGAIHAVALEIASMFDVTTYDGHEIATHALSALPSAEAVSREEVTEIKNNYINEISELLNKIDALSAEAEAVQGDAISKRFVSDAILQKISELNAQGEKAIPTAREFIRFKRFVDGITPIITEAVQGWIPCSERLPEDIKPVIITWKNTDPASYYQYIVGKHFIGTGNYCNGKWFWYSSVCEDLLAEYGKSDIDELDEAIEVIAWMPLPKPYKGGDDE